MLATKGLNTMEMYNLGSRSLPSSFPQEMILNAYHVLVTYTPPL